MNEISRQQRLPMTKRIAKLPRDHRGFPIPWFVATAPDGTRDFRVTDGRKFGLAISRRRCWVCGEQTGRFLTFVIGPMCAINRVTSEPPCHWDCAYWSAHACPFLSRPRMRRNTNDLPAEGREPPGIHLDRNPGVACLWTTDQFFPFRPHAGNTGWLIRLAKPTKVEWLAEGRPATRAEVMASIDSGYPALLQMAQAECAAAVTELEEQRGAAMQFLPAEA
jgi:hypothetical protein